MKTLLIIISFIFGILFARSIEFSNDYSKAYLQGYEDGVKYCTDKLDRMMEDDDEID